MISKTRMVYGLVATFFCYACCELIKHLGLDDALDVWGVHGMGGWIGSILCLGVSQTNKQQRQGDLGYIGVFSNYPVIWGLFHKPL